MMVNIFAKWFEVFAGYHRDCMTECQWFHSSHLQQVPSWHCIAFFCFDSESTNHRRPRCLCATTELQPKTDQMSKLLQSDSESQNPSNELELKFNLAGMLPHPSGRPSGGLQRGTPWTGSSWASISLSSPSSCLPIALPSSTTAGQLLHPPAGGRLRAPCVILHTLLPLSHRRLECHGRIPSWLRTCLISSL